MQKRPETSLALPVTKSDRTICSLYFSCAVIDTRLLLQQRLDARSLLHKILRFFEVS